MFVGAEIFIHHSLVLQSRAEVEKARRKLEGDLRVTSEALGDLERSKNEVWFALMGYPISP